MIRIFIGYDPRESIVFHTCVNSIIRHSSEPVSVIPLALTNIKNYKEVHTDGSNQFIYSRFLVPYLCNFQGKAIFLDGDMIVRNDIVKLWDLFDFTKDVMVVKHDYKTKSNVKYLNSKNEDYPRKNWSSVILWNCESKKNSILTPAFINRQSGSFLHRFQWLDDYDIGELPVEWNWLPDEFGENKNASLLHFTLGAPCFHDYAETSMASEWHKERIYTQHCDQINIK